MTKRYTILQKKLKQLESELNQVFSLSPETPHHQQVSQDIQQRFLFLKNLLSAEIASLPRKPNHLQHIAQRLWEFETAFQEWDSFQTSAPDHVEEGSTCSCTESCLNDDGEAADGISPDLSLEALEEVAEASTELSLLAGLYSEGLVDDEKAVAVPLAAVENRETSRVMEADERVVWADNREAGSYGSMRKEETMIMIGKYLGTLATGVALGMALMGLLMIRLSGTDCCCFLYDYASDYAFSLSPT